jgi:hypothetical protein
VRPVIFLRAAVFKKKHYSERTSTQRNDVRKKRVADAKPTVDLRKLGPDSKSQIVKSGEICLKELFEFVLSLRLNYQ